MHMQVLLCKADVIEEVQSIHTSANEVYRDFCDGSFVKTHPILKHNTEALQLAFYFDELEVANPLGSKRGKHKLCKSWKSLHAPS